MREDIFNHHFAEGLRVMWLQGLARAEHPDAPEAQAQAIQEWLPQLPEEWTHAPVPGFSFSSVMALLAPGAVLSSGTNRTSRK